MSENNSTERSTRSDPVFATTRWTRVLRARGQDDLGIRALGELCQQYWMPVYQFLRREGRSDDAARELAQEFFARILKSFGFENADPEKGRFRSYLLGALKHFLADVRDHERRLKRGGGASLHSMDHQGTDSSPGLQVADPTKAVSDSYFDRQWAVAAMKAALDGLEREYRDEGKGELFIAYRPWLGVSGIGDQAELARSMGLSDTAVRVGIHRMRRRFREKLREEVAHTVPGFSTVDEELRYLVAVLASAE